MATDQHRRQLATLAMRLDVGYERIEVGLSRGEDVEAWTDFWIELLRQYEQLHDTATAGSRLPTQRRETGP